MIGGVQRSRRFMKLQEVRKIWRTTSVQGFEGQGGKFKPYTPFNRKPMELFEKFIWRSLFEDSGDVWYCWYKTTRAGRCTLDSLKASCGLKWSAIQNRVQLVQARRTKCGCDMQRQPCYRLTMNESAWKNDVVEQCIIHFECYHVQETIKERTSNRNFECHRMSCVWYLGTKPLPT